MLSRIADSLFWLSRYMERTDAMLRLVKTHYILSLDKDVNNSRTWRPLLEVFTITDIKEMEKMECSSQASLKHLLIETANSNSLKVILNKARENARGVQDLITKEIWEEVNQMYHLINDTSLINKLDSNEGIATIELFTKHSIQYTGVTETTMFRGSGWNFMCLGKYIERCLQSIVITEKQLQLFNTRNIDSNDIFRWRYLLLALSGYELHLKSYHSSNHNYNALHQIVLNENFTRSILYSSKHIYIYLLRLANKNDDQSSQLLRSFGQFNSKINFLDLKKLDNKALESFLGELKTDLFNCTNLLTEYFFSYT
ncbi:MAG TPA: alpha-E domain-containing protein [Flavisolibacter sp.]|nr:alpha-E domain-containing protein [Flavisolibacter sp.]